MQKGRRDKLDLIVEAMFSNDKSHLSPADLSILERIETGYSLWLSNPLYTDKQMRDMMMSRFDLTKDQAYQLLNQIKTCLGDVRNARKEFYRYKVNYIADKAIQAALSGKFELAKTLRVIADILIKNNRLESDDREAMNILKQVNIKDIWLSCDPEDAGIVRKKDTMKRAEKLYRQYFGDAEEAEIINDKEGADGE